jgi:hypothetical protein
MSYPASYHAAMSAVIRTEIMASPAVMLATRRKVARAIREVRQVMGRDRARRELAHFHYVGVPLREWARE